MTFRTHIPSAPVGDFVAFFWYFDGFYPGHTMEKLLPDGAIELVINLEDNAKRLFDNFDLNRFEYKRECWISGMRKKYIIIEATDNSTMMGIHFKPGGAYPFFRFPITELQDRVIHLNEIWGRPATFLWEELIEAATPDAKFSILEKFMLQLVKDFEPTTPIVAQALPLLHQSNGQISIQQIADHIGISHKHLIRIFDKEVGMKPKMLSRILKFQKVIHLLKAQQTIKWTTLAYECGYYDQAHFIKEFQQFSGINPSEYIGQRGEYLNYIPLD